MKTKLTEKNKTRNSMKKTIMGGAATLIILGMIFMVTACSNSSKDAEQDSPSSGAAAAEQNESAPVTGDASPVTGDGESDSEKQTDAALTASDTAKEEKATETTETKDTTEAAEAGETIGTGETTMENTTEQIDNKTEETKGSSDHPVFEITVKDFGKITIELDRNAAPISVENFENLVKDHYYDGLTFHRIMKGFMIQGGAPSPDSRPLTPIKGEFASNGVDNPLKHERGTVSMARTRDPNSASGQFFICDAASPHLDGGYAAFGKVTSGLDVVDSIADTPVIDDNGTVAAENQPIIETITKVN